MKIKDLKLYDKVVWSNYSDRVTTGYVVFIDYKEKVIHLRDYDIICPTKSGFSFDEFKEKKPAKIGKAIFPLVFIPFLVCLPLFLGIDHFVNLYVSIAVISIIMSTWASFRLGSNLIKDIERAYLYFQIKEE